MSKPSFDIHKPVFFPAAILILLTIGLSFFFSERIGAFFADFQRWSSDSAGWFFVLAVNVFVGATLYFALSPYGRIRIGGEDATPEFSNFSWFSMLFAAGIGIGLLFYGVAEPIYHFANPPLPADTPAEKAHIAMLYTFLHWGFHSWGAYVMVGLALAYFTFNKELPLTFRSMFYPVLGERVKGWIGDLIDIVAVLAALFGLATSFGVGVQQIGAGLEHLAGIANSTSTHVLLILVITLMATASVVLGLDKGVRVLSLWNMRIALFFLLAIFILGPTGFILDTFVQSTGAYLDSFFQVGMWTEAYTETTWQNDWTIFYWAWWISWSPFVGMFIARISKGRTIREFVLGSLIVPPILIFLWMCVFGGSALSMELAGDTRISEAVNADLATSIFVFLEAFPLPTFTSILAMVLITIFFVTSSDSGALVMDSITSGGKLNPPVAQRIFWAFVQGGTAAALLFAGGLKALQSVVISTGLPFTMLILLAVYSLYKALRDEKEEGDS